MPTTYHEVEQPDAPRELTLKDGEYLPDDYPVSSSTHSGPCGTSDNCCGKTYRPMIVSTYFWEQNRWLILRIVREKKVPVFIRVKEGPLVKIDYVPADDPVQEIAGAQVGGWLPYQPCEACGKLTTLWSPRGATPERWIHEECAS